VPRPKKLRTIRKKPEVTYFKPRGVYLSKLEEVVLHFEELEALRLVDLKELNQEKAAYEMKVSRPTFQRVLASARKKVSRALISGKALKIEGGDYKMPIGFGRRQGRGVGRGRGSPGRGRMGGPFAAGPGGVCQCTNPKCKNEETHVAGQPCYQKKCSKCGSPMTRR